MNAMNEGKEGLCGGSPFRACPDISGVRVARRNEEMKKCVNAIMLEYMNEGNEEMIEMEYNGTNRGLNSNPEDLYVYRKRQYPENTTPGVEQPMVVLHLYKNEMPQATLLPLTSVNCLPRLFGGKETASLSTSLQPHSMWLKPLTFIKSANRWLPACRTGRKPKAITILNWTRNTKYLIQSTQY